MLFSLGTMNYLIFEIIEKEDLQWLKNVISQVKKPAQVITVHMR